MFFVQGWGGELGAAVQTEGKGIRWWRAGACVGRPMPPHQKWLCAWCKGRRRSRGRMKGEVGLGGAPGPDE